MLKLRQDEPGVEKLWRRQGASERHTDALHAMISTPYMEGDYVYGVDSYGELRCLDARNGDRIWEDLTAVPKARWATIHMVRNGRADVDVQRARRAAHRHAFAARVSRDQPGEADRADHRAVGPARRRLLVASGLRLQARLRPQRPGTGLRQLGRGRSSMRAEKLDPCGKPASGRTTRSKPCGGCRSWAVHEPCRTLRRPGSCTHMTTLLTIDGSQGEGGGQVLRSSLTLSLVTGRPLVVEKIRANRKEPGLMQQHLTAVKAVAQVSGAEVEGAALGSRRLVFRPGRVQAGDYAFRVGTAGSATLVLQTLLPALLVAEGESNLVLEGGTHNPLAPPMEASSRSASSPPEKLGQLLNSSTSADHRNLGIAEGSSLLSLSLSSENNHQRGVRYYTLE